MKNDHTEMPALRKIKLLKEYIFIEEVKYIRFQFIIKLMNKHVT